ncbi:hypothetical protein [Microcoleus anatoxicus]|uniref:hypothetical protein n=1 Tax=Microcoleus anatoxicus TaxID=2705319 RepID=UPI0030CA09FE
MKSNSAKANIAKNAIGLLLLLTEFDRTFSANLGTFFKRAIGVRASQFCRGEAFRQIIY